MSNAEKTVWTQMLQIIKRHLLLPTYNTWIRPLKPLQVSDDGLRIEVPSMVHHDWLTEHYGGIFLQAYRQVNNGSSSAWVEFVVAEAAE